MMTSLNGYIFRATGLLCGEFTGHRWSPSQRPVTRSFDVFFNLRLNKQLSKQSCGGWLETPSCSLWRQYYNDRTICFPIAFLKSRMIRLDCLMTLETTDVVFATWLKYQNSAICQKVSNLCFSTAYWVFSTEIVSIWGNIARRQYDGYNMLNESIGT